MNKRPFPRREFLKACGLGAAGSGLLGRPSSPASAVPAPPERSFRQDLQEQMLLTLPPSRVSLVKGNSRKQVITDALKLVEGDILASLGNKKILIKPNMSVSKNPLAVTHVDAVRAVLEFLAPHHKNRIVIGESGVFPTLDGYRNNGYSALEKEFNVELVDLNTTPSQSWYVFGGEKKPRPVRIISSFLDPQTYLISLARMKTHDCVLVTLALKNILMAAPLNDYKKSDKGFLHGPVPAVDDILHFNLFHLAHKVFPDLAVIDGYEAMEGDGPAWGTPLEAKVALASTDALAADSVATHVMGLDPAKILYLAAMAEGRLGQGDLAKIALLGTPLEQCVQKFKIHKRLAEIYKL